MRPRTRWRACTSVHQPQPFRSLPAVSLTVRAADQGVGSTGCGTGSWSYSLVPTGKPLQRGDHSNGHSCTRESSITWLVRHRYVRSRMEALERMHFETVVFLALRWDAIQRVAAGLLKDRRLTARQVRALARI